MTKLSVAILTYQEEENIEECLKSINQLADEIILVDEKSTDKTVDIARKYTNNITLVDHGAQTGKTHDTMFHIHKQLAIEKCTGDWVLQIDADERLTPELAKEIEEAISSPKFAGYQVPRKNKMFGRYLEHTGWYPDYQVKLFQNGKGRFPCKSVHEQIVIDGETGTLTNDLLHDHYKSVEQFIDRMNRYTTDDARFMLEKGETVIWSDAIKFPADEFFKRFFFWEGYKDGLHGLVLSLLKAADREIVFAKMWEQQKYFDHKTNNLLDDVYIQFSKTALDLKHWQIQVEKNPLRKLIKKVL